MCKTARTEETPALIMTSSKEILRIDADSDVDIYLDIKPSMVEFVIGKLHEADTIRMHIGDTAFKIEFSEVN